MCAFNQSYANFLFKKKLFTDFFKKRINFRAIASSWNWKWQSCVYSFMSLHDFILDCLKIFKWEELLNGKGSVRGFCRNPIEAAGSFQLNAFQYLCKFLNGSFVKIALETTRKFIFSNLFTTKSMNTAHPRNKTLCMTAFIVFVCLSFISIFKDYYKK